MQPLQITPPYGYDEIVPRQESHRVLLRTGTTPGFCHRINALAVSFSEFVVASRDYPIVFASGDNGSTFVPVVVLGLALRQYLFLTAQICATFAKLGLFSPFQFQVIESAAPGLTLEGMFRIDEAKLLALKPLSLKALVTRGLMGRIYSHFQSLEKFARIYQRAVAKQVGA